MRNGRETKQLAQDAHLMTVGVMTDQIGLTVNPGFSLSHMSFTEHHSHSAQHAWAKLSTVMESSQSQDSNS